MSSSNGTSGLANFAKMQLPSFGDSSNGIQGIQLSPTPIAGSPPGQPQTPAQPQTLVQRLTGRMTDDANAVKQNGLSIYNGFKNNF